MGRFDIYIYIYIYIYHIILRDSMGRFDIYIYKVNYWMFLGKKEVHIQFYWQEGINVYSRMCYGWSACRVRYVISFRPLAN
jgi:hypothetical protein